MKNEVGISLNEESKKFLNRPVEKDKSFTNFLKVKLADFSL